MIKWESTSLSSLLSWTGPGWQGCQKIVLNLIEQIKNYCKKLATKQWYVSSESTATFVPAQTSTWELLSTGAAGSQTQARCGPGWGVQPEAENPCGLRFQRWSACRGWGCCVGPFQRSYERWAEAAEGVQRWGPRQQVLLPVVCAAAECPQTLKQKTHLDWECYAMLDELDANT